MSFISRVSSFIKKQPGKHFCDGCLESRVGAPNTGVINDATRHLSKGGVVLGSKRFAGVCDVCGELRLVIYAN